MFGPLGFPELVFILVLVLLIFGPKKLPEIGRTLGRGLGEFRRASEDLKRTFNAELALDEDEGRAASHRPPTLRSAPGTAPRPAGGEQAGPAAEAAPPRGPAVTDLPSPSAEVDGEPPSPERERETAAAATDEAQDAGEEAR